MLTYTSEVNINGGATEAQVEHFMIALLVCARQLWAGHHVDLILKSLIPII